MKVINPHIVLDELYRIDRRPMTFDIMRSGNICIESMIFGQNTDIWIGPAEDEQRFQRLAVECADRAVLQRRIQHVSNTSGSNEREYTPLEQLTMRFSSNRTHSTLSPRSCA